MEGMVALERRGVELGEQLASRLDEEIIRSSLVVWELDLMPARGRVMESPM